MAHLRSLILRAFPALLLASCAAAPSPPPPSPEWTQLFEAAAGAKILDVATDPTGSVGGYAVLAAMRGTWRGTSGLPANESQLALARFDENRKLLWARAGGDGTYLPRYGRDGTFDESALRIALAPDGRVRMSGGYDGAVQFYRKDGDNPGMQSKGGEDLFIASFGADGSFEWLADDGSALDDRTTALAHAADGSIRMAGEFRGDVPVSETASVSTRGGSDVFVATVMPDVGLVGLVTAGGPRDDFAADLVTDDGGVLLSVSFREKFQVGDHDPLVGLDGQDAALLALAADGSTRWSVLAGGFGDDAGGRIAIASHAVYWSAVVVPGARVGLLASASGGPVVARIENGKVAWVRTVSGARGSRPLALAALPDDGVIAAGDGVLAAFDASGNERWRIASDLAAVTATSFGSGALAGGSFAGAGILGTSPLQADADVVKGLLAFVR